MTPPGKHADYYVLKHGEMFGPFSEEDLRAGLSDGRFERSDFVQVEGRVVWQPIERILEPQVEEMKGAVAPDWPCILKWAWLRLRYNLGEQSVLAGTVCLVMGTLSLVLSHWAFVFWLPWFLLAAVAGIALFRHKREGHGALLLAGAICLPALSLVFAPKDRSQGGEPRVSQVQSSIPPPLVATPVPTASPALVAPVTPVTTPAPVVVEATPAPPAVVAASVTPLPTTPLPVVHSLPPRQIIAVLTPPPAPRPSMPAPESLLSSAGKLAGAFLPFVGGSKESAAVPAPTPSAPSPTASSTPSSGIFGSFNIFNALFGSSSAPVTPAPAIDVMREHNDAFVIVKGSNGSGSGFICRVGDKVWLFTNIHVAAEIKQPTITRLDGVALTTGPGEVAAGPDIARMTVVNPAPQHPLEAIADLEANVHIDDEVAVLGNSGGGGVVTTLKGKVVGIGPDRIEVSAEFIPGNSGSPIIHTKTGKVIGIATYLTRRYEQFSSSGEKAGSGGTGSIVVRRFGYRIDKVPAWEPANWIELSHEADQIEQISKLTADIFDFFNAMRDKKEPTFATDTLRRPAQEWLEKNQNPKLGGPDRLNATERFLNDLRFIVHGDVNNAEARLRYTFFRDELKKEKLVRDRLYQAFDGVLANIGSPLNRPSYSH